MEIRKLKASDVMAIKDDLVEGRDLWKQMSKENIELMPSYGPTFTCVDNDTIIACFGGIKEGNTIEIWMMYSNKVRCFTRARAAVLSRKKLYEWKQDHPGDRLVFNVPIDLPNSKRYGDFFKAVFKGTKQEALFSNITNYVYEVT